MMDIPYTEWRESLAFETAALGTPQFADTGKSYHVCLEPHTTQPSILSLWRETLVKARCSQATLHKELQATQPSWDPERWSSPGKGTPTACPEPNGQP